jgi:hypothetical protein
MVFVTIVGIISSTKMTQKGETTRGRWCKTNLLNQIFLQVEMGMYLFTNV